MSSPKANTNNSASNSNSNPDLAIAAEAEATLAELSLEERTPKRITCMEPDLIVAVGEDKVEFHHYKATLAFGCPTIDGMLRAKAQMGQDDHRLEFPQFAPEEWLILCKFLDGTVTAAEKDEMALEVVRVIDGYPMVWLFRGLDFFGMDGLIKKYDKMAALLLREIYNNSDLDPHHHVLCALKTLPCPLVVMALKERIKYSIVRITFLYARCEGPYLDVIENFKLFLQDEDYSQELWKHWLQGVGGSTSSRRMLLQLVDFNQEERNKVIESGQFEPLLLAYSKMTVTYPEYPKLEIPGEDE